MMNPRTWSEKADGERVSVALFALFFLVLTADFPAQANAAQEPGSAEHEKAVLMAREGKTDEAILLLDKVIKLHGSTPRRQSDRAVLLSWAGRDVDAISAYQALPEAEANLSSVQSALANSYRRLGQLDKAEGLLRDLLRKDHDHVDATRGLALVLIARSRTDEAVTMLEKALAKNPDSVPLLYESALIYWHHTGAVIKALRTLTHLLQITPKHREATNEKAKLLSDMGAGQKAQEFAAANKALITPRTFAYLRNNLAAQYINWNEPGEAQRLWAWVPASDPDPALQDQAQRASFDRVLAQTALRETAPVIESYENFLKEKVDIPYWVHDAAGAAYLYEGDTDKAISAYNKTLELNPGRPESRMGLYYALVEAGRFREAEKVRMQLEKDSAFFGDAGGVMRYNREAEEVILNYGWWLTYQDRLSEAEDFFEAYHRRAPANLAIRTALGQVRLWRGWPESSVEELSIVKTMANNRAVLPEHAEQNELPALNGRAAALNNLGHKRAARAEAEKLLARNPDNLGTIAINRAMRIEDSPEFFLDMIFTQEDPGVDEQYTYARLTQPIVPELAVYAFYLHRETSNNPDPVAASTPVDHERYGLGTRFALRYDLSLTAEVSRDVKKNDALSNRWNDGLLVGLDWQISDAWAAGISHNTFSLDVPLRARAAGVEGRESSARLAYRTSELFETRAHAAFIDLDDGNENLSYGLDVERQLINRAYWKTRLFLEVSQSENSETNVPYFSPANTTTYYVRHMLQHTMYRVRDLAFVHRLHLGAGQFEQDSFNKEFIWDIRYEHDYLLTDWSAFLWGVNMQQRFYDAEKTDVISWYITYRQNF